MQKYSPATLPDVDAVELVDLRNIEADIVSQYMLYAADVAGTPCDSESVNTIVSAWRLLPSGESERCHVPPIGFRFFVAGAIVLEASVCWRCNNLYGIENGADVYCTFDAESKPAQELLMLGKRVIGNEVIGDG